MIFLHKLFQFIIAREVLRMKSVTSKVNNQESDTSRPTSKSKSNKIDTKMYLYKKLLDCQLRERQLKKSNRMLMNVLSNSTSYNYQLYKNKYEELHKENIQLRELLNIKKPKLKQTQRRRHNTSSMICLNLPRPKNTLGLKQSEIIETKDADEKENSNSSRRRKMHCSQLLNMKVSPQDQEAIKSPSFNLEYGARISASKKKKIEEEPEEKRIISTRRWASSTSNLPKATLQPSIRFNDMIENVQINQTKARHIKSPTSDNLRYFLATKLKPRKHYESAIGCLGHAYRRNRHMPLGDMLRLGFKSARKDETLHLSSNKRRSSVVDRSRQSECSEEVLRLNSLLSDKISMLEGALRK